MRKGPLLRQPRRRSEADALHGHDPWILDTGRLQKFLERNCRLATAVGHPCGRGSQTSFGDSLSPRGTSGSREPSASLGAARGSLQ
jgi:hypothetical protein